MPYLALRTNKTLTLSQEVELKTTVGKLITVFPGESVDTFMIHIEDNQLIYFKGQEANCMMITLYLKGHYTDEQKEQFKSTLEDQVKEELIFLTIADKQNIEVDEDGFNEFVDNYVSTSQYGSDADAVYSYFGNGDKKDGKSYLENAYRINKAVSYVVEKANVTENASEDAAEETTEAE